MEISGFNHPNLARALGMGHQTVPDRSSGHEDEYLFVGGFCRIHGRSKGVQGG